MTVRVLASNGSARSRVVPWVPLVLAAAFGFGGLWLEALSDVGAATFDPIMIVFMLMYAVTAGVIGTRERENRVWWLLGLLPVLMCIGFATERYSIVAFTLAPALPFAGIGAATAWMWPLALGCPVLATFLVPTGRPISPGWRRVFRAEVATFALISFVFATGMATGDLAPGITIANPVYLPFMRGAYDFVQAAFVIYLLLFVAGVAALAVRFHRSCGAERQQLEWILLGFALMVVTIGLSNAVTGWLSDLLFLGAMVVQLGTLAIAILRYRLYDIDLVIRRTVSYALITGVLATVFALLVVALQDLLTPVTESNALAVAGSTLAVAGLFQPLRRRVQREVDRRFNRTRVDPDAIVSELAASTRGGSDLSTLGSAVAAAARQAVAPRSAIVWLRKDGGR